MLSTTLDAFPPHKQYEEFIETASLARESARGLPTELTGLRPFPRGRASMTYPISPSSRRACRNKSRVSARWAMASAV